MQWTLWTALFTTLFVSSCLAGGNYARPGDLMPEYDPLAPSSNYAPPPPKATRNLPKLTPTPLPKPSYILKPIPKLIQLPAPLPAPLPQYSPPPPPPVQLPQAPLPIQLPTQPIQILQPTQIQLVPELINTYPAQPQPIAFQPPAPVQINPIATGQPVLFPSLPPPPPPQPQPAALTPSPFISLPAIPAPSPAPVDANLAPQLPQIFVPFPAVQLLPGTNPTFENLPLGTPGVSGAITTDHSSQVAESVPATDLSCISTGNCTSASSPTVTTVEDSNAKLVSGELPLTETPIGACMATPRQPNACASAAEWDEIFQQDIACPSSTPRVWKCYCGFFNPSSE